MSKNVIISFFAAAVVFCSSCEKNDPVPNSTGNNNQESTERDYEINGTKISEKANAAGLIKDSRTGKGIPDVPVTDGYTYTVTDENGVYQMSANRYCRHIYYSLPSGYKTVLDRSSHRPLFYSVSAFNYKQYNRNDFILEKNHESDERFTYIAIADPQCRNNSEVKRYVSETLADIVKTVSSAQTEGRYLNAYAMTLGDIVHDTPDMWIAMRESMSNVNLESGYYLPIYQTIGNHDHDAKESTQYKAVGNFVTNFGPTDYSFNIGNVHIISMNNIICKTSSGKTWSYNAGLTSTQLKWLQEDISNVQDKGNKMVILNVHVPFRNGAVSGGGAVNNDKYHKDVLSLLAQFKEAHIMAGHRHFTQNWVHKNYICKGGLPIYEHIHGAACGSFWSCNSNLDGSPNGYSIYEIDGSTMKNWVAKATNKEVDFQMRVFDGNQNYTGDKGYVYTWYSGGTGGSSNIAAKGFSQLSGCFVASIWNSDDTYWKVEVFQNGVKLGDMKRVPDGVLSNACATSFYFNQLSKNSKDFCISESSHYWYFKPESGLPSNEENWEIRATQKIPGGNVQNIYTSNVLQKNYEGF